MGESKKVNLYSGLSSVERNKRQREEFVIYWANYVKTHSDKDWSRQQNVLINSVLKSAKQWSKEEYLKLKKSAGD
ncbi:MAG: hypothetical protein ABH824_06560 [Nanoarchaeota archaeon]|nr:hypothetical protein [Nanoarchaeota archaeon]MBU1632032.1 hypothetical protein [Nanoarchaeota archaeon]MBU1875960.1 hypothetical protein [Nanoarchaeota archaeon]